MLPRLAARSSVVTLACVVLLCVLVGCGGDSTSTAVRSTPTATVAAGCADASALKASLQALKDVNVRQDGIEALTSALADVSNDLDAAVASASAALEPHVEQVKTKFVALQTAVSGLTTDNLVQKAPSIKAALSQLGTATTALASSLAQNCQTR